MIEDDPNTAARAESGRYDELTAAEQADVRAAWDEEIRETIGRLDFRAEFEAAGETWSEADADGHLVIRRQAQKPAVDDGSSQ